MSLCCFIGLGNQELASPDQASSCYLSQPNFCYQCGHKATNKGNLTQHVTVVHEGLKYDCTHCDYKATTKRSLKNHEETVQCSNFMVKAIN